MLDRNRNLTELEYKLVALLLVLNPAITRMQISDELKSRFNIVITYKQWRGVKEKVKPIVQRLKNDESECLDIAKECGFFKIGHKVRRIQKLEELIESSLRTGHESAGVAALRLLKEEFSTAQETPNVQVIIGAAAPPPQQEDDLTPEDEDL
ncbi:hypothetical protein NIES2109_22790 [Nostoc sp. HK-01]|nr:hypothetical protein NIES2109_22790 [Nostoc sp. HK-01]